MANKSIQFAIAYDFDGTLAPGNMQERDFIPAIKMKSRKFWEEVKQEAIKHDADNILMYMHLMLKKAQSESVSVKRTDFENYGKGLSFFDGVLPYQDGKESRKGWRCQATSATG